MAVLVSLRKGIFMLGLIVAGMCSPLLKALVEKEVQEGNALKEEKERNCNRSKAFEREDGLSLVRVLLLQACCASTLVIGVLGAPSLVLHPLKALQYIMSLVLPFFILAYGLCPRHQSSLSTCKALLQGLLGFPAGIAIAFLFATVFGVPLSLQSVWKTLHWAALMSVLVIVPAASVLGPSLSSWCRLFGETRPKGGLELAVCVPAHGAILGAWVGAWPMPLDWDRPWQAWPISCSYGAVGGYLLAVCVSMVICCIGSIRREKQQ